MSEANFKINAKTKLGGLLVAFGYATQQAIDEAFAWRKSECDAGRDPGHMGGALLVHRQVITAEQRTFALQVQKHLRAAYKRTADLREINETTLIGKILVALGMAEEAKVEESFVWQKSEREAGRDPGFIGDILINRGVCTGEQRDFGMKVQNTLKRQA